MENKGYHRLRKGFTLIELLVVLSIVSVLAAILFPAFSKARENAHQIVCMSNLRQIGLAFSLYLQDYDETFPCAQDPVSVSPYYWLWMGRGWRKLLTPYIGNLNILYCPSDSTAPVKWEATSYGYSMCFYHSPEQINQMKDKSYTYDPGKIYPSLPQKLHTVRFPAQKAIVAEWLDNHTGGKFGWWSWEGSRNYLFVDGHIKFLNARQILPANDGWPDINLTVNGLEGRDIE
jgi:prepilin-type N-terminal cleavage/methylation domain-containing protein/prepilin-type processing-associated H-X9-DG protein